MITTSPHPHNFINPSPSFTAAVLPCIYILRLCKMYRTSSSQRGMNNFFFVRCTFKPTGTYALIHFVYYITLMLEINSYVRCLTIDFSKAFNTVNHNILAEKLICNMPYNNVEWIFSFLNNKSQITKIGQSYWCKSYK